MTHKEKVQVNTTEGLGEVWKYLSVHSDDVIQGKIGLIFFDVLDQPSTRGL